VTNLTLAQSYLVKCLGRLKALEVLMQEEGYSDVVREAQEIVELALKGMLRQIAVEPPKWHDVGATLKDYGDRLPAEISPDIDRLAEISAWLRKEREFSFYGDIDLIPTEVYSKNHATRALDDARFTVRVARKLIPLPR
jgi:HEPN domain-containing protein